MALNPSARTIMFMTSEVNDLCHIIPGLYITIFTKVSKDGNLSHTDSIPGFLGDTFWHSKFLSSLY